MGEKTIALLLINVLAALVAGCVMALQPAVNARLSDHCSQPLQASWVSFGVGFAALSGILLVLQIGFPQLSKLAAAPWWAWLGGLLGTYMVTVSLLVAPQLGATRWIAIPGLPFYPQPTEFAKPMLVLFMAWCLSRLNLWGTARSLGATVGAFALVAALVILQPDISQTAFMGVLLIRDMSSPTYGQQPPIRVFGRQGIF